MGHLWKKKTIFEVSNIFAGNRISFEKRAQFLKFLIFLLGTGHLWKKEPSFKSSKYFCLAGTIKDAGLIKNMT